MMGKVDSLVCGREWDWIDEDSFHACECGNTCVIGHATRERQNMEHRETYTTGAGTGTGIAPGCCGTGPNWHDILWVDPPYKCHLTADVEPGAIIGLGVRIWHQAQVRAGAHIGADSIIGKGAYIDAGVRIGARCKIQNYACLYAPAVLEDGVFIGPHAVLCNDREPRAVNCDGTLKQAGDWTPAGVTVRTGASIGAGAIVLPGITIGAWAIIGAGAVVTRDVLAYQVVVGNPAGQIAHLCQRCHGRMSFHIMADKFTDLGDAQVIWHCDECGSMTGIRKMDCTGDCHCHKGE